MASGYNPPSLPGLAGATGTRVDSAAKHIMACKVDTCMLAGWCSDVQSAGNHMHIHKYKYCMTRDELALNTNMALNEDSCMIKKGAAYPAVVTTLGDMSSECVDILTILYAFSGNGVEYLKIKEKIAQFGKKYATDRGMGKISQEVKNLPHFMAQGYALGIAYASALSGDTVGSVLIGGMCTVMNGAFDCRAGQMLQWYFDFEEDMFYKETQTQQGGVKDVAGSRKVHGQNTFDGLNYRIDQNFNAVQIRDGIRVFIKGIKSHTHRDDMQIDTMRKNWHQRGTHGASDSYPHGSSDRKGRVAFPKPYMLTHPGQDHYGDKIRIFAKCITGARKHEMMDIMLMTQSL
jgi:hypothetical protein